MLMELCIVSRWHCVVMIQHDTMIERQVHTYDVKNDNIIYSLCFIHGFDYAFDIETVVWVLRESLAMRQNTRAV